MVDTGVERIWRPGWPCPVGQVLLVHRRGPGDPTHRVDQTGVHWRAVRTPQGPATVRIEARAGLGDVRATAWGDGAEWLLHGLPGLLGAHDDPAGFEPRHPAVAEAWRRNPHWRIGRTDRVLEALVPAILEQKVTGQEAFAGFRRLVLRFGELAPGPGAALGLRLQPDAAALRAIPSWEWLRMPVDPARSRAVVRAAERASAVERTTGVTHDEADRALRSLPGVGVWTSAEARVRAHGDADAVSFGDYHVAKDVGWALVGEAVGDDRLAELLEPYRPHRHRVQALVALARLGRPRRGPRMAPRTHLPG